MVEEFLDKVCDQIISETIIDTDYIYTPFYPPLFIYLFSYHPSFHQSPFQKHCKDVYSLNEEEIVYVWKKYRENVETLIYKFIDNKVLI